MPLFLFVVGAAMPFSFARRIVDQWVLGAFRDGTPYTWVLSSMTFTATVLLGVLAGQVLRSHHAPPIKCCFIMMMGVSALATGWLWSTWLQFPMIKHLWTSSMVLWSAGWSYLLLALFYLLIDIAGWRRWAFPLVVIGMNAITIYVAYWFIPFRAVGESLAGGLARHAGAAGPMVIAFATLLLVWLMLYHLYRQRIFLRV
jgi:predicted acyltransferase